MKTEEKHIVQKYAFEVTYDSESDAMEFQNELASFIRDELIALSDTVFTNAGQGKLFRIPHLELDLGTISKDRYREEIKTKFIDQLSEKLNLLISGYPIHSGEATAEVINPEKSDLESFQFFLINGVLPWSSYKGDVSFSINALFRKILQNSPFELKRFIQSVSSDKTLMLRLIRQIQEENLIFLVNYWIKEESLQKQIRFFYQDLIRLYSQKKILKNYLTEYKELIWEFLLRRVLFEKKRISEAYLFESFVRYVSETQSISEGKVIEEFKKTIFPNVEFSFSKSKLTISSALRGMQSGFGAYIVQYSQTEGTLKKAGEELNRTSEATGITRNDSTDEVLFHSERIERVRKEHLERKEKLIFDFLRFVILPEGKKLLPYFPVIEQTVKDLLVSDIFTIKKVFSDLQFSFNEYASFRTLEYFSEPVRKSIIQEVYGRSYEKYEKLKIATARELLKNFFTSGLPASLLPVFQNKKDWNQFIDLVLSTEQEQMLETIKKLPVYLIYKPVELLKESIFSTLKKKHIRFFSELESYFKTFSRQTSSTKKEEVSLSFVVASNQEIHYLLYYVKNNTLPEECRFVVNDLLDSFINKNKKETFSSVLFLPKKAQQKLLSFMPDPIKEQLKEIAKKTQKEVIELLKAVELDTPEVYTTEAVDEKLSHESEDPGYNRKKLEEGEPIYISNAGLIIFHPYLSRFFKVLGLLDQKGFKDDYFAHKAAHILQYLATKNPFTEEHELFLNKILCGIEPEVPLMREIEITEEDKAVCENLIEGVIANWPILKKTSNDNFRASFLLREGKIVLEDRGWRLRVEERAYDILVEKIPWSLGMVMLPWMKKLIYVEWK